MSYTELQVTTHFSFLRGASSPEELFAAAATLGIQALGVTDRNSLAGVVRAHQAAKVAGVRLLVGCRIDLQCGTSLLVYPTDRAAYGRLCRLLTLGKSRAGKGACHLDWQDVASWSEGLLAILLPDNLTNDLAGELATLRDIFGDRAYCALTRRFLPDEADRLASISNAAARARVATLATNDVLYHDAKRRMLQDVVTCIRLHTTIDNAGFRKERHADRFLKTPEEMRRLFSRYEDAVRRTTEFAARCKFSLDDLTYTYPTERLEDGLTAQARLEKLTWEGAERRYPDGLPDTVATQLRHELNLIERLEYAPYFLTVESIVRYAYQELGAEFEHRCLIETLNSTAEALRFQNLLYGAESGRLWKAYDGYFKPKERIDQVLLENLKDSHEALCKANLSSDEAQALLIQTMFIAYLEDRDILTPTYFREASGDAVDSFSALLTTGNIRLLKALFAKLRGYFNGDLFVAPCSFEAHMRTAVEKSATVAAG